jgi:hypothetical protein
MRYEGSPESLPALFYQVMIPKVALFDIAMEETTTS